MALWESVLDAVVGAIALVGVVVVAAYVAVLLMVARRGRTARAERLRRHDQIPTGAADEGDDIEADDL